ncbi:uncharacterized protein LOC131659154 [Vicia villosa]|uniref:uncharacterized protein LOC131659154 n=1 Tax=Vicia villosa TaxID=3911 RepID=UPI00273BCBAD|nr:uncharacterized protein LOC131659154 [Vicia villosa]
MLVVWNIRGLNKAGKVKEVSSRLNNIQHEICILLETQVKVNKADQIRQKLQLKGRFLDNYSCHNNGRIWINWNHNHNELRHIKSSSQFVHYGVYDFLGNFKYWLTTIYALNQLEHRRRLWTDIEQLSRTQQGPWCLIGDFNNVLQAQDGIGGNLVIENEYKDLQNMINTIGLCEMPSKDHAMLHVAMTQSRRIQHGCFKFHNSITNAVEFQDVVRQSWILLSSGTPMNILWHKLMRLRKALKSIQMPFSSVQLNLARARQELTIIQTELISHRFDVDLMEKEKKLTTEVIQWNDIEEKKLCSKGLKLTGLERVMAIVHSSMPISNPGMRLRHLIENEVMEFYSNLMGKVDHHLQHIDVDAMRKGNQLNLDHKDFLVRPVTIKEIQEALKGMGDLKAPGLDGYGAKFYKSYWNTIKEDVTAAVREFFTHQRILNDFNKAVVSLIPKTDHAVSVKEYRPIVVCSTFYKIISGILSARLGTILPDIVSISQAAFIPGQVIHNHIMLAYEIIKGYNRKGGTPRVMLQLDLQKAYDMVSWTALENIMHEIGIPHMFIKWILTVITNVAYVFNINDDVLLFCRGDRRSVEMLIQTVTTFSKSTGLLINPQKCKAYYGGLDETAKQELQMLTTFEEGNLPFRYLGVPC